MSETPRPHVEDETEPEITTESASEGPPEIVEAARQELEYPSDETDEG
jgi:hypothetical protein